MVRIIVCFNDDLGDPEEATPYLEECTHVDLDSPLAGRTVVDFDLNKRAPFYVPTWLDDNRTGAPGFYSDCDAAVAGLQFLRTTNYTTSPAPASGCSYGRWATEWRPADFAVDCDDARWRRASG
jgi:hypothetical protein